MRTIKMPEICMGTFHLLYKRHPIKPNRWKLIIQLCSLFGRYQDLADDRYFLLKVCAIGKGVKVLHNGGNNCRKNYDFINFLVVT